MKKLSALVVLPVIALASCGKSQETTPVEENTTPVENTTSQVTPDMGTFTEPVNENIEVLPVVDTTPAQDVAPVVVDSTSTGETTPVVAAETVKAMNFTYDLYGKEVKVVGNITVDATGKISAVTFDDATSFEIGQAPLKNFTEQMKTTLIGKDFAGLQIDTVTGATLVSTAFNQYLTSAQ